MKNYLRLCYVLAASLACLGLAAPFALAVPANDDFINADPINGFTGTTSGKNIEATTETGEPGYTSGAACQSVWYTWQAPANGTYYFNTFGSDFDTILAVYTGPAVDNLTPVTDNDDFFPPYRLLSSVSFTASLDTIYHIAVDGALCDQGNLALNWSSLAQLPGNDNFANASSIAGPSGTTNGTNINATPEVAEPSEFGQSNSSVWYSWTAPSSGPFIFDTLGSDFDTTLTVYTGNAVDALSRVASNDDADFGTEQSRVAFIAEGATTYSIVVDGYGGRQGNITLNWQMLSSPPSNDDFVSATNLSGKSGTVNTYNFLATTETGEPYHAFPGGPFASIWFAWTATYSGKMTFDTLGSDFDTTMAAYTGTAVDSLTKITENDDSGYGNQSSITLPVLSGTTYYIAVDGYQGAEGTVILNWKKRFPWPALVPVFSRGSRP